MELYKKYRPKDFNEVLGNESTIKMFELMLENNTLPQTILFEGTSGQGKTTLARILASKLGLSELEVDEAEYNCSDQRFRGIEGILQIMQDSQYSSFYNKNRVYILDEVDQITSDAQKLMKKYLEDTPKNVYYFLCTTRPEKLIVDIRTRATEVLLAPTSDKVLGRYIKRIAQKENTELTDEQANIIIEKCEGSIRKAMVILDQIINTPIERREDVFQKIYLEAESVTIDLCRALLKKEKWENVKDIIKGLNDEPEKVRYAVLGYCSSVLLKGGFPNNLRRANDIITMMSNSYMYIGKAGLIRDCFDLS